MKYDNNSILRGCALAAFLAAVSVPCLADWAIPTAIDAIKPSPDQLQVQAQNPPSFAWSRYPVYPRVASYVLEIRAGVNVVATYSTKRNFYLPSKALPSGSYTWRVRPVSNTDWSTPRGFVIDATSKVFEVPELATLKANVLAHGRSRQLAKSFTPAAQWSAAMRADRGASLTALTNEVNGKLGMAPVRDATWSTYTTLSADLKAASFADIASKLGATTRQLEAAALLYRLTGDIKYFNEAVKRGDELVALDPNGPTGYANQDQVTRAIALSLVKAADLLWLNLNADKRGLWLAAVNARVAPIYADLSGNDGRLDQYPYDSHGAEALGYLALISTLSLGDIAAAQDWFDFSIRTYVNSIYVWSGPEGGYSNGTAYGQFTTAVAVQLWPALSEASGVNLFSKPWSSGFAQFFMHFTPPGAPGHVFGDAHESFLDTGALKSFMARFNSPAAAWYVKNQLGVENPLYLLAAPYPLPVQTVQTFATPANAALYPSIGWVAMHSNIADRARTSVYFKSSPFGTFNHSHGDHNSLVIDSGGRRLLIEAGYQDYFMSPLGIAWYRTTKAHNAITFDNGIGQPVNDGLLNLTRSGKVTAFSTTPALDFAEGDATQAYAGLLNLATRKVWYLRTQDAVVVLDKLTAAVAHSFEWNMHSNGTMVLEADGTVKITNVDRTLCIRNLSDMSKFQTRVGPAPKAGVVENHGAFVRSADMKAEFLVVLDVGCKRPAVSLSNTSVGRNLTVGAQTVSLPK